MSGGTVKRSLAVLQIRAHGLPTASVDRATPPSRESTAPTRRQQWIGCRFEGPARVGYSLG